MEAELLSGTGRCILMSKLADLVDEHRETLATIETLDNGKPYSASLGCDLPQFSEEVLRYHAGYADKLRGSIMDVGPREERPRMDAMVFREKIFGPCAAVARFEGEADAIETANASRHGLASAVFTSNLARAHRVARELEAGMVWVNSSNDSDVRVPFGGVKESGIGRELGREGLGGKLCEVTTTSKPCISI
ncbi:Aldehyde dehydrogenase [Epichloe bromicola]|uniref:aldehyde dehydrogenase (NAD(+)) n=1 Tax=Epichloe bromicola TaxID=79588 RepID=A0ABQ0D023_9HYPO